MRSIGTFALIIPAKDAPRPRTPLELHEELRSLLLSLHRFQTDSPTHPFSRGVEGLVYYGRRLSDCGDAILPFNRQYEKAIQFGGTWYASWHEAAVIVGNEAYVRLAMVIDGLCGKAELSEESERARASRYAELYTKCWHEVERDNLLAEVLPVDCDFLYQQTAVELARMPADILHGREVVEHAPAVVSRDAIPNLMKDGRAAAIIQAIHSQSVSQQDGMAIVDLPKELHSGDYFHLLWADGLIQFIRRRHCFVGPRGHERLVLERGYDIAELHKPDRLQPGALIEEALKENVDPAIRHRVRLTVAGMTAAIRLALLSSTRADNLRYYCDPAVPNDVQRMVIWMNPPHCLSQRKAAKKAAEDLKGSWTSIESRFRRHRDETGLIKKL
jgi:hypothetical protein